MEWLKAFVALTKTGTLHLLETSFIFYAFRQTFAFNYNLLPTENPLYGRRSYRNYKVQQNRIQPSGLYKITNIKNLY